MASVRYRTDGPRARTRTIVTMRPRPSIAGDSMAQGLVHFGAALCALTAAAASAQEVALSFTAEQAAAGRAAYDESCAICHGANLNDGPLGAPLKGDAFMRKYGGKAVRALFDVARTTMPTANPGSLPVETYAALVALMLDENDIVAGEEPLPTDPQLLAAMQVPAGGFSFMAFSPYTARAEVDRPTPLDDFSAVSDDSIAEPPAGDWLGWRRSYDAQGFSPLRDIDTRNVADLRLAWSWTMPAGSRRRRAARARRHDLRASLRRHRASARCEDGRPAMAVHAYARARGFAVSQARPRAAWRPALPRHVRRPRRRARRRDRRSRVGHEGRRLPPARRLERRAARRTRQGHGRHDGHGRRCENRWPANRRARRRNGRGSVAARHDRKARRARRRELERHPIRSAQRRVRLDARQLRSVDGPRLLRHRQHLRHGAAARAEQARDHQRRALHELDARRGSRHGRARLALPAFPERPVGSRLGVRAPDHGLCRSTARRGASC